MSAHVWINVNKIIVVYIYISNKINLNSIPQWSKEFESNMYKSDDEIIWEIYSKTKLERSIIQGPFWLAKCVGPRNPSILALWCRHIYNIYLCHSQPLINRLHYFPESAWCQKVYKCPNKVTEPEKQQSCCQIHPIECETYLNLNVRICLPFIQFTLHM